MSEQNNDGISGIRPHNPSVQETIGKIIIGLIVGVLIAFFIFIILILVGSIFQQAIRNRMSNQVGTTTNPLLPLILIVISFISTFIGNIIVAGAYSLFFPGKYYDLGKMFTVSLITNVLLFIIFAPLYILFYNEVEKLFVILAFHVFFAVFVGHAAMEFISNPNYSTVYLIGGSFGFAFSILIFAIAYKSIDPYSGGGVEKILLSLPPILAYTMIPLLSNLWEKLYYKFYENGNNFLYISSIDDVLVEEEEVDEINVEDM